MKTINEKELNQIFKKLKSNNDEIAFELVYSNYNKIFYRVAFSILKNKEDAEDVVQTVFIKIHTMPKEKLPNVNIASWIYTVTKNEAISILRKRKNNFDIENVYEIADADNEINNIIDQESYNQLISKLSDKDKEIISLKILTNLSFDEIAKLLNMPTGTIKWRYYKSIHTLKMLLSNLAMFIVTFVIGLKTIKSKNKTIIKQEKADTKQEIENKIEDATMEKSEENEEGKKNSNTIESLLDKKETKEEVAIPIEEKTNDTNYSGIGILSISGVFLIITIIFSIFFIKHQLKLKSKSSK